MRFPIPVVEEISAEIKEKGKVERGWLGVSIGEDEKGNVGLIEVEVDSPAEEAGLEVGDVIRKFDGKDVKSSEMLVTEVQKKKTRRYRQYNNRKGRQGTEGESDFRGIHEAGHLEGIRS